MFIVLGYQERREGVLARYLAQVARELAHVRASSDEVIVTSGGVTAKRTAPGVSEAQLMADHLVDAGLDERAIIVEGRSRTTLENFRNSACALRERGITPTRAVVFCDAVRETKVAMLARAFFPSVPTELRRHDFERTPLQALVQRTLAVAHDAALLRWPLLERVSLALVEAQQRLR